MVLFHRIVLATALSVYLVGGASAATVPSVKVFEGTLEYAVEDVGQGVLFGLALGLGEGPGFGFEMTLLGEFDADPLGVNPSLVVFNIFDDMGDLFLSSETLLSSVVEAGPIARLMFDIDMGTALERFRPHSLVVLSGLVGPDSSGSGAVRAEVFLAPIPLPAAAPMLVAVLAGLALLRVRRRA